MPIRSMAGRGSLVPVIVVRVHDGQHRLVGRILRVMKRLAVWYERGMQERHLEGGAVAREQGLNPWPRSRVRDRYLHLPLNG